MRCLVVVIGIIALSNLTLSKIAKTSHDEFSALTKYMNTVIQKQSNQQQQQQQEQRIYFKNIDQSITYSLGSRINGDTLLHKYEETFQYPAKKNVSLELVYPQTNNNNNSSNNNGNGKKNILTYIEINCLQDNEGGNAYLINGGIGQTFIEILLEAKNTEYFSYSVQYYGS